MDMDTSKCRARSCDALNITDQESQRNLQMFTPIVKQERVQHSEEAEISQYIHEEKTIQCIDKEETFCNDYMSPCKPLLTSDCVNYRDSQFDVFEEIKKELPDDECPQPIHASSKLVIKNEELSQDIGKQEIKQETSEESVTLIKNEKNEDENYPFIVKKENLEEHRVLDDFGDSSVHYDVLVTPQQVQCNLCDRTFNNRYTLLIHYNEHKNNFMYPTQVDIELNELHKCKCCHEYFDSRDNMLAHVRDVHSNETHKSEICPEIIKPHLARKNSEKLEYKCNLCERVYKSKHYLLFHIKTIHVDYGKMFECSCGKEFRTPIHLSLHKSRQHNSKAKIIKNQKFQCDSCHTFFKSKAILKTHIKRMHYDYGKTFECWCGKQFRAPMHLSLHKKRQHNSKVEMINNQQFQCDSCHNFFKTKPLLIAHIKRLHYEYGKTYECFCGKQFRTPVSLSRHKSRQHNPKVKIINDQQFQCDSCHIFFKNKYLLLAHLKSMHYDYGKTFESSGGKQFGTSSDLYQHNQKMNGSDVLNINNGGFQCHICQKLLKTKKYLAAHIKSVHYDYGKTFDCRCGKQFRTPRRLRIHESLMHSTNNENSDKYQCDSCGKIFKNKEYLTSHIKYVHYDYGSMFLCWCGKQFSKPILLRRHERQQHNNTNMAALKAQFQCDFCPKLFKTKKYLKNHTKRVHHDYGKLFECVCGKQFRTPIRLRDHEKLRHHNKNKYMADVNTNIAI